MKRIMTVFLTMIFMLSVCFGTVSFCQEDEVNYAYGVVVEADNNAITIEETVYDESTGEAATGEEITKKIIYKISPEAELENIASIKDLQAGDEIDVEYVEKDGEKTVTYIYRYTAEELE